MRFYDSPLARHWWQIGWRLGQARFDVFGVILRDRVVGRWRAGRLIVMITAQLLAALVTGESHSFPTVCLSN
jgi:hypothetical protein